MNLRVAVSLILLSTAFMLRAQDMDIGEGGMPADSSPEPEPKKKPEPPPEPPPPPPPAVTNAAPTPAKLLLELGDKFPFRPNPLTDLKFWEQTQEMFQKYNKPLGLVPLTTTAKETVLQMRTKFDFLGAAAHDSTYHFAEGSLKKIKLNLVKKGNTPASHGEEIRKMQLALKTAVEAAEGKSELTGNTLKCQAGGSTIEVNADKGECTLTPQQTP